jgi:hypothetical protein
MLVLVVAVVAAFEEVELAEVTTRLGVVVFKDLSFVVEVVVVPKSSTSLRSLSTAEVRSSSSGGTASVE